MRTRTDRSAVFIGSDCCRAPGSGGDHSLAIPRLEIVLQQLCAALDWYAPGEFRTSPQATREHRLVSTRRDGQSVRYALASGETAAIIRTLHEQFCGRRRSRDAPASAGALRQWQGSPAGRGSMLGGAAVVRSRTCEDASGD